MSKGVLATEEGKDITSHIITEAYFRKIGGTEGGREERKDPKEKNLRAIRPNIGRTSTSKFYVRLLLWGVAIFFYSLLFEYKSISISL